ncbi:MAG: hypothetical protein IJK02_01850 [Clostridia bacterium]|nr:hypothetical protein [Clostridia bacterium]
MGHKRRWLLLSLTALLLAGVVIVHAALQPKKSEGVYENKIVDRVNFSLENTSFVLNRADAGKEISLDLTFRAKKNEADFYAVLESLRFEGITYRTATFTCMTPGQSCLPEKLPLPAENGEPVEMVWEIVLVFTPSNAQAFTFYLDVEYTAGLNEYMTDDRLVRIPVNVTFA